MLLDTVFIKLEFCVVSMGTQFIYVTTPYQNYYYYLSTWVRMWLVLEKKIIVNKP